MKLALIIFALYGPAVMTTSFQQDRWLNDAYNKWSETEPLSFFGFFFLELYFVYTIYFRPVKND